MIVTTSSNLNETSTQNAARLRLVPDIGIPEYGWIPASDDSRPWIQLQLDEVYTVRAVVTQGCVSEESWVSAYCISYTQEGDTNLVMFGGGGGEMSFDNCKVKGRQTAKFPEMPRNVMQTRVQL